MSESSTPKLIGKTGVSVLVAGLMFVSYLAADETTTHDSNLLMLLNACAVFFLTLLGTMLMAVPSMSLYYFGLLNDEAEPKWLNFAAILVGILLTLKASTYFIIIYEHYQNAALEIVYGH